MNEQLITTFYKAFSQLDSEGMAACYHDDIVFTDPAFGTLKGEAAKSMWKMLCKNAQDLTVVFSDVQADEHVGSAQWKATYIFSQTGRKVINSIQANFEFRDGKIIKHTDNFNLRKWAGQALGFKGWLLGGTGFFKKQLHQKTSKSLRKFMETYSS